MPLSRASGGSGRAAAPVRLLHLGVGNFFRAHQAFYTDRAADREEWGIAAFAGRGSRVADVLAAQDGLYTLVTRGIDGDSHEVIASLSRAYGADRHDAWLRHFADPALSVVTITVTEAGYVRGRDGRLDRNSPQVQADIDALRRDLHAPVRSAPARLVAGLAARRGADAGPLTLVPCDNLPGNGSVTGRVVRELAETVDPPLAGWIASSVATVTTVVDRITPRTESADVAAVAAATGRGDAVPVVTEPFHEWVLGGPFAAGRPAWQDAGATFTEDVGPYENRKLWLLNGAHSLLAYAGSLRGHATVDEAVADDAVRGWLGQWWAEASAGLRLPADDVARYREALLGRFANPRMRHRLHQIAADGSQKLPVRILPTLAAERAAGRVPPGATRVLAAWVCHLRGLGTPVDDVRADELVPLASGALAQAVPRVLAALDPVLGGDDDLVAAAVDAAAEQERRAPADGGAASPGGGAGC